MMEARLVFVALERCICIKGYARRSIMKVKHLRERNACTFLASISVVIRQQRTVLPHNDNVYSLLQFFKLLATQPISGSLFYALY